MLDSEHKLPHLVAALTLLALLFSSGRVQARTDDTVMAGVLPGGAPIYTSVETFKEQRFHNVVAQGFDFSCGAAALATVLKYAYGMNLTEHQVFVAMYAVGDRAQIRSRGFSLLDMKKYLDTIGYNGLGYRVKPEALFDLKVPVIVLLNMSGYEHFVVLRKATPDYMYVADPALGNRMMAYETFMNDWVQEAVFAVVGPDYNPDNPLAVIQRPLGTKEQAGLLVPQVNPMTQQSLSSILSVSVGPMLGQ